MHTIYILKHKTDANFRKPFVGIYKSLTSVKHKVTSLQSRLRDDMKHLITYDEIVVDDFDSNKKSIYIVYDKTDAHFSQPIVAMCSDLNNATNKLNARRAKVSPYAQKLIYMGCEPII